MTKAIAVRGWWLAAGCLALGAVQAQEIEFVEPSGGTVRGKVQVAVSMPRGYRTGFVSFYVGKAGDPLSFEVATVAGRDGLFGFEWATQKVDSRRPDGEYRLLAVGFNAAGEVVGQRATTVELQNEIPQPARGILLRHNLSPGRDANFIGVTHVEVSDVKRPPPGPDDKPEEKPFDPGLFSGRYDARWRWRSLWRDADGRAQVRNAVHVSWDLSRRMKAIEAPASGKAVSYMMEPVGDLITRVEYDDAKFPFGELNLEFPSEPVKVGDTWRSATTIWVSPREHLTDTVVGTHTLSSIQWEHGYRCAVIDTVYSAGPYRVTLHCRSTDDADKDDDTAEELHGATIVMKGKRRTYFAYQPEVGRLLRVEEQQEQACSCEYSPENAAGGGMMGGAGGAGGPGMMGGPGGMMGGPGGPGGPGMMGGPGGAGGPGMMGPGQPGQPGQPGMPGMMGPGMPGQPGMTGPGAQGPGGGKARRTGSGPGAGGPGPGGPGMMGGPAGGSGSGPSGAATGMMPPGAMPGTGSGGGSGGMPGMGGMGGAGGNADSNKVAIMTFKRTVETAIFQDYLDVER
ncbi:MAG: hypothetical protein HYU66_27440 [Armatimonadetes bacterium]|nr:hypothetical protein [Armatimonadota bacterium]